MCSPAAHARPRPFQPACNGRQLRIRYCRKFHSKLTTRWRPLANPRGPEQLFDLLNLWREKRLRRLLHQRRHRHHISSSLLIALLIEPPIPQPLPLLGRRNAIVKNQHHGHAPANRHLSSQNPSPPHGDRQQHVVEASHLANVQNIVGDVRCTIGEKTSINPAIRRLPPGKRRVSHGKLHPSPRNAPRDHMPQWSLAPNCR